jgi:hypothetical protein
MSPLRGVVVPVAEGATHLAGNRPRRNQDSLGESWGLIASGVRRIRHSDRELASQLESTRAYFRSFVGRSS